MSIAGFFDVTSRLLGAAILLSSAQWLVSVYHLRLDLLFGWGPRRRLGVLLSLLLRSASGILMMVQQSPSQISALSLFVLLLADVQIYRTMKRIQHAVFRMIHILGGILLVGNIWGEKPEIVASCLMIVAGVSILSYLTTGISKLVLPGWRKGETLKLILASRVNGCGPVFLAIKKRPFLLLVLAWSTILFECFGPFLIFAGWRGVVLFCAIAASFHLVTAAIMGMNLFTLTWAASYPALLFVSGKPLESFLFSNGSEVVAVGLALWFGLLVAWQFVAWIKVVKRFSSIAFYFFLYEFYMFART